MDFTLSIILNRNSISTLFHWRYWREQIKHEFVVDFQIRNLNSKLLIEMVANFLENLSDCSWNDSSVLIVLCAATHSKSLASSSLSIDHNSPIEAWHYTLYNISCTALKDFFLRRIVKNLIELETPLLLLVIDMATWLIFWNLHSYVLNKWKSNTIHLGSNQYEDS